MIYDNDGNNINNYNFTFSGSVKIIEVNEDEEYLIVYYYRIHRFYKVDFSGEIISISDNNSRYINNYLRIRDQVGSFDVSNNFFWYSVKYNDNNIINRISLLPFIIFGITVFFGGMLVSVKRIKH